MIKNHLNYKNVIDSKVVNNELVFKIEIRYVKKGEYLKKNPESKNIFKRLAFDRCEKKFEIENVNNTNNSSYLKSNAHVWIGFSY